MDHNIIIDLKDFQFNYKQYQDFYATKRIPDCPDLAQFSSSQDALNFLSEFILDDLASVPIFYALKPLFLELISRLIENEQIEKGYHMDKNWVPGSSILNTISKITIISAEVATLAEYFLDKRALFNVLGQQLETMDQNNLKTLLVSFYRLLVTDLGRFKRFVRPSVLYDILNSSSSLVNKFLAIELLALTLGLAEAAKTNMLTLHIKDDSLDGSFEGEDGISFRFFSFLEAQRLSNFTKLPKLTQENNGQKLAVTQHDLSFSVISVCGVLIPVLSDSPPQKTSLVPIEKSLAVLKTLAYNIRSSIPTMLVGEAGTGKTFLINELAHILRKDSNNSIIKIHLNEQTDAKILLGTYTSDNKPGSFKWKNGVLTTAVKEGKWILIEDIDRAPTEVLSILLTLLEKHELTIPSRGEVVKAANGFQLLSTITTDSKDSVIKDMIGLRLWQKITLPALDDIDLKLMLQAKYPPLTILLPKFIAMFEKVTEIYSMKKFVSLNKASQPRKVSLRDFVKFCHRVNQIMANTGVTDSQHQLESEVYDMIFQEAVDCFTSSVVEITPRDWLVSEIGYALEIPASRIHLFLNKNVPVFEDFGNSLRIGRAVLQKNPFGSLNRSLNQTSFARTSHSLRLMEQIGVAISMYEPLLLTGETGTGKTTVVQHVAKLLNKKLTVINVSQQTEVSDLLGGYKPVNTKLIALPIQESFEDLFNSTFSLKKNAKFVSLLSKCFNKNQWKNVVRLWKEAYKMSVNHLTKQNDNQEEDDNPKKRRKLNAEDQAKLLDRWNDFKIVIDGFEKQSMNLDSAFAFQFVEGALVKAVRNGDWLLLDEINLAAPETLENIADLLSEAKDQRNILLSESGDIESIKAHDDFRLFGCMNPSTDVGKKDLPSSIRSRFSEIYVHSPDRDLTDLLMIIDKYIGKFSVADEWCGNDIAELYLEAKALAESNKIVDGANQKPHFSIRTLTRTLVYVCDIVAIYGLRRSLYEGFCMSFLTLLDQKSEEILRPLIEKHTVARLKNANSVMMQIPSDPSSPGLEYVQFRHYWMKHGPLPVNPQPQYIITPFVEKNMLNLVRATGGRRYPVLIQGPTSSGKTSMINYLANITGHKFVRINNHEHTDLQEYLGTYLSDETGKLVFKEGILVNALRNGHWIVLDELNLAPTDVLEALNRLLDDNRELFIPETQEIVRPHPDFMLFATQNPPGLYGGRKILSRAFRNRFLELHFDDIPQEELETILRERCQIAPSYGKKIVEVYHQLSIQRQSTRFMEQGNSFATLRDLFRWAQREAVGYEELAANGYMLLAERVRREDEKLVVKNVIEKVMRVKLDIANFYENLEDKPLFSQASEVVWTNAMRRLSVLVSQALKYNEPVLLVGETGCGKTTICQLIADYTGKKLIVLNAHQNTETGDILGAQRPLRNRFDLQTQATSKICQAFEENDVPYTAGLSYEDYCKQFDDKRAYEKSSDELLQEIQSLRQSARVLFEWSDGPLIQAMKEGDFFLLDEISLADDSVLERLNSVLEAERSLLLAEKGSDDAFITADSEFKFLATMNPGGDYGKKELSPALRNRFTEIWVPSMNDFTDVAQIVNTKLSDKVKYLTEPLVAFSEWFGTKFGGGNASSGVISLRDILAWVTFINKSFESTRNASASFFHGASMVFIDSLGTNNTAFLAENEEKLRLQKAECVSVLSDFLKEDLSTFHEATYDVNVAEDSLHCGLYAVARVHGTDAMTSFNLQAPTTAGNVMRVLRALQVQKPILLEGSPGVGKTSLVSALATATGNELTRINLSEQTDLIDLFGSDAPAEGGDTGEFVWRDAPFLRAMKLGEWVLLDEMNLASQSVLEGLNACLDHRGEAYIPELDKSFPRHPNFTVFAAQNPQYQGGGRKGLPKSFVNRFSVVYVDMLKAQDLNMIAHHLYPNIEESRCSSLISYVSQLEEQVVKNRLWGSTGAPWEFNLRDTLRWLQLLNSKSTLEGDYVPSDFFDVIISQRFRTEKDRELSLQLFNSVCGSFEKRARPLTISTDFVESGIELLPRNLLVNHYTGSKLVPLQCHDAKLETMITCINKSWPLIMTGPSGSGKTSLIRYLAALAGAELAEFSINTEVDSMDILGGYEQVDLTRVVVALFSKAKSFVQKLISINLQSSIAENSVLKAAIEFSTFLEEAHGLTDDLDQFAHHIMILSPSLKNRADFLEIKDDYNIIQEKVNRTSSVRFEWFDGLLVQAVEQGKWLVLDNANLCSPSVLDRLNSLLEPNGSLIVNECSDLNGQPRIVKTHPNFRLFLTVDPKYGELSRAMRNRGIEMYLDALDNSATWFDDAVLGLTRVSQRDDNNLEKRFDNLTIYDNVGKALSAFSYMSGGISRPFFKLTDLISFSDKSLQEEVSSLLATSLPFNSDKHLSQWIKSVEGSSEFNNQVKAVSRLCYEKFKFLASHEVVNVLPLVYSSQINESDELRANETYVSSQTLNPALSAYTSRIFSQEKSSGFFYLFEVAFAIMESRSALEMVDTTSLHGKLTELNYLERSAAVSNGRNIKPAPKIHIYKLVKVIAIFIDECFEECCKDVEIFCQGAQIYEQLHALYLLWKDLMVCSQAKNEAKMKVFNDLIDTWVSSNESRFAKFACFSRFQQDVHLMNQQLALTSGHSIYEIWEHFRATYPTSSNSWANYEAIKALSFEFDQVADAQFSDTYDALLELKVVIMQLLEEKEIENLESFESVQSHLESGVASLKKISSLFLNKRMHHFKAQFKRLINFIDAGEFSEGHSRSTKYLTLSLLAGESTLVSASKSRDDFKPYPRILDSLYAHNSEPQVEGLFSNVLLVEVLEACRSLKNSNGFQMNQSFADLSVIGSAVVNYSSSILKDQRETFKRVMTEWFTQLCAAHVDQNQVIMIKDLCTEVTMYSAEQISRILDDADVFHLRNISNQFFIPALLQAHKTDCSWEHLGRSWVIFTAGCIQLFVPNIAIDPAIREYVHFDIINSKMKFHKSFVKSWTKFTEIFSNEVHVPQAGDESISRPRVYRPLESSDSVFDTWNAFFASSNDSSLIEPLLEAATDFTSNSLQQLDTFQKNSSNFLIRLGAAFPFYADLNDILQGFVFGLKLGFELMSVAQMDSLKTASISANWSVDVQNYSQPGDLKNLFISVKDVTKTLSAKDYAAEKIYLHFMKSIFINGHQLSFNSCEFTDVLAQVFQGLYYRWSLRSMKQQEEEQVKSNLFKYTDQSDDAEEDFKRLFPDYDELLNVDSSANSLASLSEEEVSWEITEAYMRAFNCDSSLGLSELITDGAQVTEYLKTFYNATTMRASDIAVMVSQIACGLNDFELPSKEIDFYYGFSPLETKRCTLVMEKAQGQANKLLQQWPEHATLQNILRASTEALEYPVKTPVAKLLAKVEQVYTFVAEWEKYAHSKVSFKEEFDALTQLIISWRQLELRSWKKVFENESSSLMRNLGKWWFHLFETIIVPIMSGEDDGDHPVRLVQALNIFLTQTTYGEFEHRLNLVKSFKEHVKLLSNTTKIADTLSNVVFYYEQFVPIIGDHISAIRKSLEKDVNEIILLASWKDVNVEALKQSSRRSHHNLYKIVRKYRAVLTQPLGTIIEDGLPASVPASANLRSLEWHPSSDGDLHSVADEAMSIFPSNRNIFIMEKNLESFATLFQQMKFDDIYDFCKDLMADMESLKKDTPRVATEDNKKEIAALKTQKRKLLSDTIKEARRIGLKTTVTENVKTSQSSMNAILASANSFCSKYLEGSDPHFLRLIDLMPRLRGSVSNCAEDVPVSDAQKSLAVVENLFYTVTHNRKRLVNLEQFIVGAEQNWKDLLKLSVADKPALIEDSSGFERTALRSMVHWFPILCDFYRDVLVSSQKLTTSSASISIFDDAKVQLQSFEHRLSGIYTTRVFCSHDTEILRDFGVFITTFAKNLELWKEDNMQFAFVADSFKAWISNANVFWNAPSMEVTDSESAMSVRDEFKNLILEILISVQKAVQIQKEASLAEGDDGWVQFNQAKLTKIIKALSLKRISERLTKCFGDIQSAECNMADSKAVSAFAFATLPFLRHYINMAIAVFEKARAHYANTSHGTFMLALSLFNLSTNGFCSPEEEQKEQKSEEMKDGTGLGDGEGSSNSKDADVDEDDLAETAQQPNEDQKERDNESDDNDAVDIEGDMAGELEDAPESQNEDDEEGEDQSDLDEEVDDIDDLDPNAIDEKMWDEEAKDDKKEKDSDKMPDNSEDNGELEAKEDKSDEAEAENHENDSKADQEKDDSKESEGEDDADDGEEEDVGEQDDAVTNKEDNQLEQTAEEADALELPEDMNLDSENDEQEEEDRANDEPEDTEDHIDANEGSDDEAKEKDESQEDDIDVDHPAEGEEQEDEQEDDPNDQAENHSDEQNDLSQENGDSDIELNGEEQDENSKEKAEEEKGAGLEGLDGVEDQADAMDLDIEASAKQNQGNEGQGVEVEAEEEKDDIGASGSANQQPKPQENDQESSTDQARQEAKESLKQLGDSLKEFHRRQKEILEMDNNDVVEQDSSERPDDFQHVDGDNADETTQALGAANNDQIKSIDEDQAIDDDENAEPETKTEPEIKEEDITNVQDNASEVDDNSEADEDDADGPNKGTSSSGVKKEDEADIYDAQLKDLDEDMFVDVKDEEREIVAVGATDEAPRTYDEAFDLWRQSDIATQELAAHLCEQLRLILEPTLATKLRGDFKTGKRLNMKRIIPYIASQFRKDKIWLRRTKPSKRQYQIMIAVDDSKSMAESNAVNLAFDSIALVAKALTQLESGGLSIVKFGEETQVVHPFDKPFTSESGAKVFQWFDFKQTKTDIKKLCSTSINIFDDHNAGSADLWQLEIIISDGVCENHATIQRLVRKAREEKIMLVFVVIDGINSNESIMEMSQISYVPDSTGKMVLRVDKYLDTFPFEFYVVVRDVNELPEMLSVILRQYFSELASL